MSIHVLMIHILIRYVILANKRRFINFPIPSLLVYLLHHWNKYSVMFGVQHSLSVSSLVIHIIHHLESWLCLLATCTHGSFITTLMDAIFLGCNSQQKGVSSKYLIWLHIFPR